jgi:NADH:ubiquinone oxidoreductase subunit F (NADH-binding)/NADH:ubiquinone oxidoreductase subunit E
MSVTTLPIYETRIVPALHAIQHRFGYLRREELIAFARQSGLPLYRIESVASFFPHFRKEPPPAVTVRVCRDMACHMNGSAQIIQTLSKLEGDRVKIEGASCLGRCDRPVAAVVVQHDGEHERLYCKRKAEELAQIVTDTLRGSPPDANHDEELPYKAENWVIDPYKGKPSTYDALKKAVVARRASLQAAAEVLMTKFGWDEDQAEQFRIMARRRLVGNFPQDKKLLDAVRDWQTENDWAKGPTMGGWSDPFLTELDDAHADLRGMGGAGIPASRKWRDVREAIRNARRRKNDDDRGFIVVNGDESEPATFKDRELLLRTPHLIIEAVILAGLITEATEGFIYIRHEYHEQIEACEKEIRRCEELGVCGMEARVLGRPFKVSVFTSPGGYICGEQSALIEAMSDSRAEPRNMPPTLETNGLDDQPTLVSNVETFGWAPYIIINGGENYAKLGVNGWKGRRFFSISGDVKRPGVYEVPMGMTLRELVCGDDYCGGIIDGKELKGFAPSGPSGGFIPAKLTPKAGLPRGHKEKKPWLALAKRRGFDPNSDELDILDLELELNLFRALSPTQALGAGVVVYAEGRDMIDQAAASQNFYRNESCGKCVPCRIGSQQYAALGQNIINHKVDATRWKSQVEPVLGDLGRVLELTSICGLGRSVPVPLRTAIEYFPADLAKHLAAGSRAAAAPARVEPAVIIAEPEADIVTSISPDPAQVMAAGVEQAPVARSSAKEAK